ncbi:MAG: hypothetical protein NWE89_16835 [Candidatus Bathyarchaeota archaeon]|nr:hypothetical protein [Candidatus Bathyarchaeota archaeon]
MGLTRIRQVKKEIRVLGIAVKNACSGFVVVGVVYRGRLAVDGVISCLTESHELTDAIVGMVVSSRHLNQIRVIILDVDCLPEVVSVDPFRLAEGVGKPVLLLQDAPVAVDERFMFMWGGRWVTCVGLVEGDASRVLDVSGFDGVVEALRVASLVVDGIC